MKIKKDIKLENFHVTKSATQCSVYTSGTKPL